MIRSRDCEDGRSCRAFDPDIALQQIFSLRNGKGQS